MVHLLTSKRSVADELLYELRDRSHNRNRQLFRDRMKKLGWIMAYEISQNLEYKSCTADTGLGEAQSFIINDELVLCPVLRAGLAMYEGMHAVFSGAETAFVSAYRKHKPDGSFDIQMNYVTCPDLTDKTVLRIDPMLATGMSLCQSIEALEQFGIPKSWYVVCAIASQLGIQTLEQKFPLVHIFAAAIDEELTAKSYIVPGLGDAGDLAYGQKLQE